MQAKKDILERGSSPSRVTLDRLLGAGSFVVDLLSAFATLVRPREVDDWDDEEAEIGKLAIESIHTLSRGHAYYTPVA